MHQVILGDSLEALTKMDDEVFDQKEHVREYNKKYFQEHREEIYAKRKERGYYERWYQKNKERISSYHKRYRLEHGDTIKAYQRTWYRKNRDRLLQKAKKYQEQWYDALRAEVLSHYSTEGIIACIACGEERFPCLSIDHVKDNGAEHRRELGKGGRNFYRWLKEQNYPEGYQTLCMNCQFVKDFRRRRGHE